MAVYGPDGTLISSAEIALMREDDLAGPDVTGVRQVFGGHPADRLTPARLAQIHASAARGESLAYIELAEDIEERDQHYAAVLGTRKRGVSQLPVTVEAASDDAAAIAHKDFIDAWLRTGVLDTVLFDVLDAVGKGYSVHEIVWDTSEKQWQPNDLIWRTQRYFDVSQDDGETVMLRDANGLAPLAAHKFIVHRHKAKSGLLMRSGLARVASWAWMYKTYTQRDWQMFVQNYGAPVRVGKYGPEANAQDKRTLLRAVSQIAGDMAAVIPRGMEIEFVETGNLSAGSDLYLKRVEYLDQQISKLVLGQTTTTDAVSGGHAVAREHRLVQEDIERADAKLLAATLNRQLIPLMISLNFGPQKAYPSLRIGRPDEIPLPQLVEALEKLVPLGLPVEVTQILDRLGIAEPAKDAAVLAALARTTPVQPAPSLNHMRALNARQQPDVMQALMQRVSDDATGALAGMTEQVRAVIEAAPDLATAMQQLQNLNLSADEFAAAMQRGMALAHLAGQAALLDEMQG